MHPDAATSAYRQHSAALAASPAVKGIVAELLLLQRALPCLLAAVEAPDTGWDSSSAPATLLGSLCSISMTDNLPGVRERLRRAEGTAFPQQAARLLKALPLVTQDSALAGSLAAAYHHAARLLLMFCIFMDSEEEGAGSNHPGNAASSQTAGSSPAGGAANQQKAAWVVIGLVPHLAAAIQALAAFSPGLQEDLASICHSVGALLSFAEARRGSITSQQQLEVWLAAGDAGLRLQPLLRQLDASWRQQDAPPICDDAAQATAQQVVKMLRSGSIAAWRWAESSGRAAAVDKRAGLAAQLAQLHSRGCRLLHWLAAVDNRAMLPGRGSLDDWMLMQESLSVVLSTVVFLQPGRAGSQPPCAR